MKGFLRKQRRSSGSTLRSSMSTLHSGSFLPLEAEPKRRGFLKRMFGGQSRPSSMGDMPTDESDFLSSAVANHKDEADQRQELDSHTGSNNPLFRQVQQQRRRERS